MEEKESNFSGNIILARSNYLGNSSGNVMKACETAKNEGNRLLDEAINNSISEAHNGLLYNEASKIVQIGLEKDLAILEKDKIINNAMETIDGLKKNIVLVQIEYEQLGQKYQKEMSYRAEVLKRIDTTRNMIESAAHYSNILATSIRQLEDDKFKIAEFYNEIHQRQEETEEKRKHIDAFIKEHDDMIKNNIPEMIAERDRAMQEVCTLKNNLALIQSNLKHETDKTLRLETEIEKFKNEIDDVRSALVREQTNRIKSVIYHSHLKKQTVKQRAEDQRIWNTRRILLKRKIKFLNAEIKLLKTKLTAADENTSHYLNVKKDLEKRAQDLEKDLLTTWDNNAKMIEDLQAKLNACLSEKEMLYTRCESLETESREKVSDELESLKLKLQENGNELDKVMAENINLKRKAEELIGELQNKTEMIANLEAKIPSQNLEQLLKKSISMEEKLGMYSELERELRDEIFKLYTEMTKERCDNDKTKSEQETRIRELENDLIQLKKENQTIEDKLKMRNFECIEMENELKLKSHELQKVVLELDNKIRAESIDRENSSYLVSKMEDLKLRNEEMTHKIQKMEDEKAELERDLRNDFERELSLNKTLTFEIEEKEKCIKKLQADVENGQQLLISQQEKLNKAEYLSLNLKEAEEKVIAKDETISTLKKNLESAEANLEAHRIIVKKLEDEVMKRKATEEKNSFKSKITQFQQRGQKTKNVEGVPQSTPKKAEVEPKNDDTYEGPKTASKTATTSRRILSTPVLLLGTPSPSPNLKNSDPYEYDSDSSTERFNSRQILKAYKRVQKKGTTLSRRKM